jgi:hypothetical protein
MRALLAAVSLALAAVALAQPGGELDRAYEALVAAHKSLAQAQAAREAGVEPQPGERLGIVGGGSRLSDDYWERQKRLDEAVDLARKRLDEAIARWNSLR